MAADKRYAAPPTSLAGQKALEKQRNSFRGWTPSRIFAG